MRTRLPNGVLALVAGTTLLLGLWFNAAPPHIRPTSTILHHRPPPHHADGSTQAAKRLRRPSTHPSSSDLPAAPPPARPPLPPLPALDLDNDDALVPEHGDPRVRCKTTKGDLDILVVPAWAPHGARRFLALVHNNFFTNSPILWCDPWFALQVRYICSLYTVCCVCECVLLNCVCMRERCDVLDRA